MIKLTRLVFNNEDLTWEDVSRAAGVTEERFNLRSREPRSGGQGSSSQARSFRSAVEEEDEADDEGYKSDDGDYEGYEDVDIPFEGDEDF